MTFPKQQGIAACNSAAIRPRNGKLRHITRAIAWTLLACFASAASLAQTPLVGIRDFSFGSTGRSAPTAQKPESKLWFNDGIWWGSLYNDAAQANRIYRLDPATQTWVDTGTQLDERNTSSADVLWDQATGKLYVASHKSATSGAVTTDSSKWGRLYRYTYNPSTQTYVQDSGFPVTINNATSETMVLAKDSTGQLWITYTAGSRVWVNRSTAGDDVWGTPFLVPASATSTTLTTDDISSIIAFAPGKIGILWSNQLTRKFHFAVHLDSDPDNVWQPEEQALPVGAGTENSDDHIDVKTDSSGRVFAAVKTSLKSSTSPLIKLLVRDPAGVWTSYTVGRYSDRHTRPNLMLDTGRNKIFVFAPSPDSGTPQAVYYKVSDLGTINFPVGRGAPLMQSDVDKNINNPTSTKQNLGSATGVVVMASDSVTQFYLHNTFTLSGGPQPAVSSFTPASSPPNVEVTINGSGFTGATTVAFNGRAASQFTIVSDAQIKATIPTGATTGTITVNNPSGLVGTSAGNFTVTGAPIVTAFSPTSGIVGTAVVIGGRGFTATSSVTFNGVPATFTVASDSRISTRVPDGATTGPIRVTNPAGSGTSAAVFTVLP